MFHSRHSLVGLLVWGLVLTTGACQPPVRGPESADSGAARELSEADRAAIRAADSSFMAAANTGNLDGILAVYAADASLLPPNMPPQKGREAIRSFWGGLLKGYTLKFELGSDTIEGRGDLAYHLGHYRLTAVPKAPADPGMADEGKFVEILKKQPDASWKYVVDMYSSNLASSR